MFVARTTAKEHLSALLTDTDRGRRNEGQIVVASSTTTRTKIAAGKVLSGSWCSETKCS